jgi:hypothetical protein
MDEGDSRNNQQIKKQAKQNNAVQGYGLNDGSILQSIWIRCRAVFPYITDRKFMESELRFVLYSGVFFWFLYILFEIVR